MYVHFGTWDYVYIYINIFRPALVSQAELGTCYFVPLIFYSYLLYNYDSGL
ncbi:uncharacterized protein DS421_16g565690 [Arachis hypogaea]|nr:uncharacterized protein DS421_16g565690 [Arachis hypogaea]